MNGKKLYRNTENKMLAGVCSGIADYFDIDPTLVRLGWVLFSLLGGSGLLGYIIAAIVINCSVAVKRRCMCCRLSGFKKLHELFCLTIHIDHPAIPGIRQSDDITIMGSEISRHTVCIVSACDILDILTHLVF